MDDLRTLEERMSKLSSDELLEIVTIDFRGYRKEAIAIARAELNRRGFRESDIRPPKDSLEARQKDRFPSKLGFLAFTAGVGLVTFLLFPAAVYYSIIAYGLIASVFMTVGYVIWRELMRTNPRKAMGFSTGFIPPVLLILGIYLFGTPWLVLAIVAEFLVFCIALKFLWPVPRSPLP